jgi:hypothetical protein
VGVKGVEWWSWRRARERRRWWDVVRARMARGRSRGARRPRCRRAGWKGRRERRWRRGRASASSVTKPWRSEVRLCLARAEPQRQKCRRVTLPANSPPRGSRGADGGACGRGCGLEWRRAGGRRDARLSLALRDGLTLTSCTCRRAWWSWQGSRYSCGVPEALGRPDLSGG